jgi:hypothetical protein
MISQSEFEEPPKRKFRGFFIGDSGKFELVGDRACSSLIILQFVYGGMAE